PSHHGSGQPCAQDLSREGDGRADRRTGKAVPRRRAAAWAQDRSGAVEYDQEGRESVVRSENRGRPPEPDPHHVQTFRQTGGEAAAHTNRIPGIGFASRTVSFADDARG